MGIIDVECFIVFFGMFESLGYLYLLLGKAFLDIRVKNDMMFFFSVEWLGYVWVLEG